MNPVSLRLLDQQLICPQFSSPHDVVEWMGAMQAQDYRMMRWAVGMRTRRPSAKAFRRDFDEGRIIRTHLFRSTWQLVSAGDYRWMTELYSDKARSAIRGWMKMYGLSVSETDERRYQEFLQKALKGRGSLNRIDFEALVQDSPFRGEFPRLKHQNMLAEVSGVICSGDLDDKDRTYVLAADKIPSGPALSREDALAELARRYFRSHGPATLEDFVWWSGLGTGECRKGLEAIDGELTQEHWKGLTFHIHRDSRTRGFRSGRIHLLPAYDEYLIGYKSRQVVLHPDYRHHAHDQKGVFWPVVLQDGEVIGNWSPAEGKVKVGTFYPEAAIDETALQEEIGRYRGFIEG